MSMGGFGRTNPIFISKMRGIDLFGLPQVSRVVEGWERFEIAVVVANVL
jgi:hypothetical protein